LRLVALGLAVAFALSSLPAQADFYANDPNAKDPNRPAVEAMAKEFAPVSTAFGVPEFAWGKMDDPASAVLEFVPTGDDVRKWTRLMTITTIGLPDKPAAQLVEMKKLQGVARSHFGGRSKVLNSAEGADPNGAATLFLEYEVGKGAALEHNALGVVRLRPNLAGIVQIQARGKRLSGDDVAQMKAYALAGGLPPKQ
jgi:hypothetical protein